MRKTTSKFTDVEVKVYVCDDCGEVITEKVFVCDVCDKQFCSNYYYAHHNDIRDDVLSSKYFWVCHECYNKFWDRYKELEELRSNILNLQYKISNLKQEIYEKMRPYNHIADYIR